MHSSIYSNFILLHVSFVFNIRLVTHDVKKQHCSYMASFSSQVLFSGLYLLSSQALFRASRRCLFLFPVFSLCGFFEDLCFLDSLLSVFRNSGGNGRNEPLQYIAGLHPVIEESIVFPINNLDR